MEKQRFAQKAVVLSESHNEVLVIRYGEAKYQSGKIANKYGLPGGKIEIGQTVDESIKNECIEETGVIIRPGLPISCWNWEYEKGDDLIQINAVARVCLYLSGELLKYKQDKESEIKEVRWVEMEKLLDLDWVFDEQPVIELFLKYRDFYIASLKTN